MKFFKIKGRNAIEYPKQWENMVTVSFIVSGTWAYLWLDFWKLLAKIPVLHPFIRHCMPFIEATAKKLIRIKQVP